MSDDVGRFEKVFFGVHQQMLDVAMKIVADDTLSGGRREAAARAMKVLHRSDRGEQARQLRARSWRVEDLEMLGSRVSELAEQNSREGLSRELEHFVEVINPPEHVNIGEPDDISAETAPLAGDPVIYESSGGDITINELKG